MLKVQRKVIGEKFGHINMPLLIKTKVKPSSIEGLGLYADEDILKGAVVWLHDPILDGWFYADELNRYTESMKDYIKHFCCYDKEKQAWIKSCDNANWMNHSKKPNLGSPDYYIHVALKDIKTGEELTLNYDKIGDEDEFFDSKFTPN